MISEVAGAICAFASGSLCHRLLLFAIWATIYQNASTLQTPLEPTHISSTSTLKASPPKMGTVKPIEISPAVIPHSRLPLEPLPPMYPTFPLTYDPVLTGRCPVNFSAISNIMDRTASDCNQLFAPVLGNVICCPQFSCLLHIFQGFYSINSDNLVLLNAVADDCFKDIVNILASRGANGSIPAICSVKSSNLTGGSCPVKDINTFEGMVNTSRLLEACTTVDPLKECCRPVCQTAIIEAALKISGAQSFVNNDKNHVDMLNDCKGVVYSWMSRALPHDAANTAYRILSACKVNKACPLDLKQPSEVIAACKNVAAPSPSCCSSLNSYIGSIQKQMLITNRQAIICATKLGSMLQKGGVMTNVFELCDVDLKDFSLQTDGQEGCLLRSLPADLVYDKSAGLSITCDLNDNIAAPWPSSSSLRSLSLCAPEMSLPAIPKSKTLSSFEIYILEIDWLNEACALLIEDMVVVGVGQISLYPFFHFLFLEHCCSREILQSAGFVLVGGLQIGPRSDLHDYIVETADFTYLSWSPAQALLQNGSNYEFSSRIYIRGLEMGVPYSGVHDFIEQAICMPSTWNKSFQLTLGLQDWWIVL